MTFVVLKNGSDIAYSGWLFNKSYAFLQTNKILKQFSLESNFEKCIRDFMIPKKTAILKLKI